MELAFGSFRACDGFGVKTLVIMDAQAKAVQKANAVYEKAAMAAAKAYDRAWNAKAKAYAKAKAPMPKQPAFFLPGVAPPPEDAVAVPMAAGQHPLDGYPFLAKAATYRPNPYAPPIHFASDNNAEGRMMRSRRVSASALDVAKAFIRTARELHNGDPRTHYDPKATAVTAANGADRLCATLDATLREAFGNDD